MLHKLAGEKLDQDCVSALVSDMKQVEEIQRLFNEAL